MLRSEAVKQKKNFSLSEKAHSFATKLSNTNASLKELKEFAILGFAIGINFDDHIDLSEPINKNISDTNNIDEDGKMLFMYINLFPNYSDKSTKTWLNIEKAASFGLSIIEDKYFDADENLILWEKLYRDFGNWVSRRLIFKNSH